jgi:hypothetical protein
MRLAQRLGIAMFGVISLSAAQGPHTYTGTITDDVCAGVGHAQMQMGPTDADCTRACVIAHGAAYVLEDGKTIYALSDQVTPDTFAGQAVTIVGTLDAATNTIRVESITAAP